VATKKSRGREGDEVEDYGYNLNKQRRRSNSSSQGPKDFKTKFETIDPEPVFEENIHGPEPDDLAEEGEKAESADSSTSGGSVAEEEHVKKV
jgi:hypothetical protein